VDHYDAQSDAMRERWRAEGRKFVYVCQAPPHNYSDACIRGTCRHERLPLWFWVAVAIGAALFGIEAWMVWRVFAGWPVGSLSILQKLAG
jgi:hypothetical protein